MNDFLKKLDDSLGKFMGERPLREDSMEKRHPAMLTIGRIIFAGLMLFLMLASAMHK